MKRLFWKQMRLILPMLFAAGMPVLFSQAAENPDTTAGLMDQDGDGHITSIDLARHVKTVLFPRLDQDENGSISREEWLKSDTADGAAGRFESADANRDGSVDAIEFSDYIDRSFDARKAVADMDADSNGYLTSDELARKPGFSLFSVKF